MNRLKKEIANNESGTVAIYVAIGLVVLMGFAALALDTAHLMSVKRELTKAAEAGALAGARGLWPENLSTATSRVPNGSAAGKQGQLHGEAEPGGGANLTTAEVTAEAGRWDYDTKQFTPGNNSNANGVKVTTTRANVQMILAQVLGHGPQKYERQRRRHHGLRRKRGQGVPPDCR